MKPALRLIPSEVWVDVLIFPWISRWELGEIVHGFRNRKFVEIIQYCLHERRKRTLDTICLGKDEVIPRTPLPENISFFENIMIRHFDSSAMDFLHQISPLFINGVNLWFDYLEPEDDLTNHRTVLHQLSPFLLGIHSFTSNQSALPLMEQYFAQKLAQINMISLDVEHEFGPFDPETTRSIDFCMDWLLSEERDPIEPRFLRICFGSHNFPHFTTAVQEQFHSATTACTFAIKFIEFAGDNNHFAEFHMENGIGEQLHGELNEAGNFKILRHQPNGGKALQEWVEEIEEKYDNTSVIEFSEKITIGQIEASANGVDEALEEEANQPSTSKKRKLT